MDTVHISASGKQKQRIPKGQANCWRNQRKIAACEARVKRFAVERHRLRDEESLHSHEGLKEESPNPGRSGRGRVARLNIGCSVKFES